MGKGEHVGDYPPPTDTERERTQGLRAMLRNANLELPRTMRIPANGGEARAILRFTRARKDTDKSYAMLEKSLEWRREVGADARNPKGAARPCHTSPRGLDVWY